MRILFLPLITRGAALGTISRCLAVADVLRERGHAVCFLTNAEGRAMVEESGFSFLEGAVPDPPESLHHPLYNLSDTALFLGLAKEEYIRRQLEAERRAVEMFRPDALFSEFKLTAPVTAGRFSLPLVSTACSPAHPDFVSPLAPDKASCDVREAVEAFNRILDAFSLPPVAHVGELFFGRSTAKVAPTIKDLEPLLADVPNLAYVGALLYRAWEAAPLPPDMEERIAGRDPVYVYLSQGRIHPDTFLRVLPEAFDGTEFYAAAAVGDHPELPETLPFTPNTGCWRFVPAGSMLERSRVLIFHGGQNTAMASLIHGVPSLGFPGFEFERDFNVRGLEAVGAGLRLPLEDFRPEALLARCRELCAPGRAKAARDMGKRISALGGARRAAEIVLETGGAGAA